MPAVSTTDPARPELGAAVADALWALTGDPVLVVDAESGRIEALNPAAAALLALPPEGACRLTVSAVFEDVGRWLARAAAGAQLPIRTRLRDRPRRANGGDGPPVEIDALPLAADGPPRVCLVVHAAPAPEPAASDLGRAQRLESIGLLAGGIAHDFNNLLTGILGQASLALALLPADSPARTPINKAAGAAGRAADLTRQLLAYAGRGAFRVETLAVNDLIIENIGLLETVLPKGVRLQLDLDPELPAIEGDRGQVQQVLMNLVLNAGEAVGEGSGRVAIRTATHWERPGAGPSTIRGDEPPSGDALPVVGREARDPIGPGPATPGRANDPAWSSHPAPGPANDPAWSGRPAPGRYVVLEVTDTGTGMPPETVARIFEPFFSTKGDGRGLGLSATLGIIRSHAGALSVESQPGVGTRFRVLFPVAAGRMPSSGIAAADDRPSEPGGRRSRVLVVDDEPAVREATVDMLEAAGHEVLTAVDGRDGVACFAAHRGEIDVVLLDMKMPGMDGEQALQAMRRLDPQVNAVVMTGYSEAEAIRRFGDQDVRAFLQKPFDFATLVGVVAAALA
jgi:two-component system, cell cycle sensor histidine kinase and response regulator CckA